MLYQTEDGRTRVECRFSNETLWLSQAGIAELFQTSKQNIAKHLKAIFAEGELVADAVVNYWLTTAADGKSYRVAHYNIEAIVAVGYRVRSRRGTQFRRWATERLGEYLLKGFTMDDERLKSPTTGVYFEELLERIRDIRSSERPRGLDPRWPHIRRSSQAKGCLCFNLNLLTWTLPLSHRLRCAARGH